MRFEQETSVYKDATLQNRLTDLNDAVVEAQASADGKNTIYYSSTAPTGGSYADGDVWFDTDDGNAIYIYSSTQAAWVKQELGANAIANLAITNAKIADSTIQSAKIANLDGGKITAGSISAIQLAANSINAEKLAIGDFTNYATINELYPASMNTTAGTETAIDSGTGMVVKADPTQEFLPLVIASGVNPFRSGDEVRYSLNIKSDAAGDVLLRVIGFNASNTWICENAVTLSLTTSVQKLTGVIKLSSSLFDSAAYYRIAIRDARSTKSQIYFSQAQFYRRLTGDLIVDGAITADMITAGTMSADRINGGTLTLGGSGNTHGVLIIQDASGNNAGTWNNNGLTGAKLLQTAYGNQKQITFDQGSKQSAEPDYSVQTRLRLTPNALQAIDSNNSYTSQIVQARFAGTAYDKTALNSYGWYLTPMLYCARVFTGRGETVAWGDIPELQNNIIGKAYDDVAADFVSKYDARGLTAFTTVTNWNTPYLDDDDMPAPVFRLLYGYNATNAPASNAHIVAIELNFSATHRVQLAFRTNATASNPVWVRHCNNGSWLGWGQITAAAPAT